MMRSYSIRPMFLGACVLSCKAARDDCTKLVQLYVRLDDLLNLLSVDLLVRIEHQLLEVLDWRLPMGTDIQLYADEIFRTASELLDAPMRAPRVLPDWQQPAELPPAALTTAKDDDPTGSTIVPSVPSSQEASDAALDELEVLGRLGVVTKGQGDREIAPTPLQKELLLSSPCCTAPSAL